MQLLFFGITGLALGIVTASLRVPKVRMVPLLAAAVLAGSAVLGMLLYVDDVSHGASLLLIAISTLASTLYGARLWQRENLDPSVTYWGWVQREFFHPSYGRRVYAQSKTAVH